MKIFYHDDNDGKVAAHIVYLWAKNLMEEEINKTDFFPVNYGDKIPDAKYVEKGETVFIVDYSFTEATYDNLSAIAFKANGNVFWYDHHKTSLEIKDYVVNHHVCKDVVIDMNRSGSLIAYDQLIKGTEIDNNDIMNVVRLVDDHDRWIHNDPNSMLFNNGSILYPNGPTDDIWHSNPDDVVKIGKVVKKYRDINANKIAHASKYFVKINDKICIVLNTPIKSSQEFGDLYEKYKFAIRWSFDGVNYEYSVYSSLEGIDCAAIAKHFDKTGGGHRGAAGFRSNKLEFKQGFNYRIRMK